jgi:DNA polymerase-3 subunit alpha (Gram-positive type)
MHDVLVKLDILGPDDPTMLKKLQDMTGIPPQKVPLDDKASLSASCRSSRARRRWA